MQLGGVDVDARSAQSRHGLDGLESVRPPQRGQVVIDLRPMTAVEPKRAAPRSRERAAVCERNQCIRRPGFGGAEATVVVAEVAVEFESS